MGSRRIFRSLSSQYQSLNSDQHDQFKSCIDKKVKDKHKHEESPLYHILDDLQNINFNSSSRGDDIDSCCSGVSSDHQVLVKAANPIRMMDDVKNKRFTFTYQPYTFNQFSTERLSSLYNFLAPMWPMNHGCGDEYSAIDHCVRSNCSKESPNYADCIEHWDESTACSQDYENYIRCNAIFEDFRATSKASLSLTSDIRQDLNDFIADMCQVRIGN